VQPGGAGYPVLLTWDPAEFPAGTAPRLQDQFGGTVLDVDMRLQTSFAVPGANLAMLQVVVAPGELDEQTPVVATPIADQDLIATAPPFELDLEEPPQVFVDPQGDPLSYSAVSSDPAVATVRVTGSVLAVQPLTPGSARITVTADDGQGHTIETSFLAHVTNAVQGELPEFTATLNVTNGSDQEQLVLGIGATATEGLDPALGEQELPPSPPQGVFDARLTRASLGNGSLIDIIDAGERTEAVWTVRTQPGAADYPVQLSWDPQELPASGTVALQDLFGGVAVSVDMRQQDAFSISGPNLAALHVVFTPAAVQVNHVPELANDLADLELVEAGPDTLIDLSAAPVFTDADGDSLMYEVWSSDPGVVDVQLDGSVLDVTPGGVGTTSVTVQATDGRGGFAEASFAVTVRPEFAKVGFVMTLTVSDASHSRDVEFGFDATATAGLDTLLGEEELRAL